MSIMPAMECRGAMRTALARLFPRKSEGGGALGAASSAHAVHDGYSDLVYLMLPFWQAEFALSLAQTGFLKTAYSGALALFQIPAALLAERLGERLLLIVGTGATALGFFLFSFAPGFVVLAGLLMLAGLASGVQHPLASSLIARAVPAARTRAALSFYNFAGDVGKAAFPATAALLIAVGDWRLATAGMGLVGLIATVAMIYVLRASAAATFAAPAAAKSPAKPGRDKTDHAGFAALGAIAVIDTATRSGFLTFLPFVMTHKGAAPETLGLALALVLAGGATGKFVCGLIAERVGIIRSVVITELCTTAGIVAFLPLSLGPSLILLPLLGLALNGTSSVLYGSVVDLVAAPSRARAFGVFYTLTVGAGAVAPFAYGLLSDAIGIDSTLQTAAAILLLTLPATLLLRRPFGTMPGAAQKSSL